MKERAWPSALIAVPGALGALCGTAFFMLVMARGGCHHGISNNVHLMKNVLLAMKLYKGEYGDHPCGGNAETLSALLGKNERKIVFLEPDRDSLNAKGELLDSWGTPFRMSFHPDGSPQVRSAGKNRQWGDRDDESAE